MGEDPVEFVERVVADDDLALAAAGRMLDGDLGSEGVGEPRLELQHVRIAGRLAGATGAGCRRIDQPADQCFGFANGKSFFRDQRTDFGLLAAGRQAVTKASVRDLISADMAFHSFFYELADNPIISQSMETHWVNTQRVMGSVLLSADKPRDIWDEHETLFELVAGGEAAKAEQLARTHIQEAANFMLERLSEQIAVEEE